MFDIASWFPAQVIHKLTDDSEIKHLETCLAPVYQAPQDQPLLKDHQLMVTSTKQNQLVFRPYNRDELHTWTSDWTSFETLSNPGPPDPTKTTQVKPSQTLLAHSLPDKKQIHKSVNHHSTETRFLNFAGRLNTTDTYRQFVFY